MSWFSSSKTKARKRMEKKYREEDRKIHSNRCELIKQLANKSMKTAELGRIPGLPVRDHVVVPYEDLLKIWDMADRIKNETPI